MHGAGLPRHHRAMRCANDQAATGGTAEPAGVLLSCAMSCGLARRACGTSRLSHLVPLIPPNPAYPGKSRLSHRIPPVPPNPACPTESRLSHRIPLIPPNPAYPAESRLSHRIPLIPPNPAYPAESRLSHRIPPNPAESRLSHRIPPNPACPAQIVGCLSHSRRRYWMRGTATVERGGGREGRVRDPRNPRCIGAPPCRAAGSGAGRGRPRAPPSRGPAMSRRAVAPLHRGRR